MPKKTRRRQQLGVAGLVQAGRGAQVQGTGRSAGPTHLGRRMAVGVCVSQHGRRVGPSPHSTATATGQVERARRLPGPPCLHPYPSLGHGTGAGGGPCLAPPSPAWPFAVIYIPNPPQRLNCPTPAALIPLPPTAVPKQPTPAFFPSLGPPPATQTLPLGCHLSPASAGNDGADLAAGWHNRRGRTAGCRQRLTSAARGSAWRRGTAG